MECSSTYVNRIGAENARRSHFVFDFCRLIELESKHVIVVVDSDDGLEDKDSASCDNSSIGAEIGVLPENAIILFVTADDIWHLDRLSI